MSLHLVSHPLCPYVQRAAISMFEKAVEFERTSIDLSNKPGWFVEISPLGKTLVLLVGDQPIFESSAILEYLEETQQSPLHPIDPLSRAQHRGWIEFGSDCLNDIAGFYSANDATSFDQKTESLRGKFSRLEGHLKRRTDQGKYFFGDQFTLVDAVFGPVFRYFDIFDKIADFGILSGYGNLQHWRGALQIRPSVRDAVASSYSELLLHFLLMRNSHLSKLIVKG